MIALCIDICHAVGTLAEYLHGDTAAQEDLLTILRGVARLKARALAERNQTRIS